MGVEFGDVAALRGDQLPLPRRLSGGAPGRDRIQEPGRRGPEPDPAEKIAARQLLGTSLAPLHGRPPLGECAFV